MKLITKTIQKINGWQRQHAVVGFPYAVMKKYGEDEAGKLAALLTYYGFLSLFPLLLVLATVLAMVAGSHSELRSTVISGVTDYFPILGNQLSEHIHTLRKSGIALAIGMLFTLYGARGVAEAFIHGVNHIWQIPRSERPGWPKSSLKSLTIILVGGSGFVLAALITAFAAAAGRGWEFQLLSVLTNLFILFGVFLLLINISLPARVPLKDISAGAVAAAIGLVILQNIGGYLLAHQLKNLDALYSNFAIVLGLLFWLYLQAQMVYYAIEIAAVQSKRLWPRNLT